MHREAIVVVTDEIRDLVGIGRVAMKITFCVRLWAWFYHESERGSAGVIE